MSGYRTITVYRCQTIQTTIQTFNPSSCRICQSGMVATHKEAYTSYRLILLTRATYDMITVRSSRYSITNLCLCHYYNINIIFTVSHTLCYNTHTHTYIYIYIKPYLAHQKLIQNYNLHLDLNSRWLTPQRKLIITVACSDIQPLFAAGTFRQHSKIYILMQTYMYSFEFVYALPILIL